MPKHLRYAVSIKWPRGAYPVDSMLDMLRYSTALVVSWGQDSDTLWVNLQVDYTDMNPTSYKSITFPRWESFGFKVQDKQWFIDGNRLADAP